MIKLLCPHRIARLNYLLRIVCFVIVSLVLGSLIAKIAHWALPPLPSVNPQHGPLTEQKIRDIEAALPLMLFLAFCYIAYFLPFIAAPRLRDIGLNPWLCLVYLVKPIAPYVALIALCFPSDSYTNWRKNRHLKDHGER